ncbi:hypothetical protein A2165_04460 [Candidatus Curtissbacteria bacterium RBG_13_40_7]|uniref:SH3b domain-containing protein n=1 Tax=Candidatus Curtissbacteria bacterium RBG_13_40_7 TaxID=1797706 RepID=A0A1F5FV95_9BACT|nr:MAG: hypothetical protein A2165_04460 [Candidatus Curtissbacteria bacterium RBG_13_40_7]
MPFISPNTKKFILTSFFIILSSVLTGCSAVGSNKPAALQVTSTPEASVFLDGKHLGKTPFFSDQLKAGEYLLKITVSEASFIDKITLTSGTLTVVNRELNNNFLAQSGETLWLKPSEDGLFISSLPQDADLTIDGKSYGKTPALVNGLTDGEHKVALSKPEYIEREFSIKTANDYQLIADVTLASEVAKNFQTQASPTPMLKVEKVEILKTPQGFLRVRAEPSLNAQEIGRVKTGDQLEIIQETKDWIKITFEGKQGWISAQYTKKL